MAQRRLRILCFGDSLTSGYSSQGLIYHPYNEILAKKLEEEFPDVKVEITADGQPGDITGNFMGRILRYFERDKGPQPYDWTIVLGGTNDLAYQFTGEQVFENLEKVWRVALLHRSKVLALTVPEAGVPSQFVRGRLDDRRNALNKLIKEYKRPSFYPFDFHAAVPYFAMSKEDNERYWDDLIHLTSDGYDLMGEKIAGALIDILQREPNQLRKRRVFKDDDNPFVEEDDDPTSIDKGYVVVRKKDLD